MKSKFSVLILILSLVCISSCYKPEVKPDDFDEFWDLSLKDLGKDVVSRVVRDTIVGEKKISLVAIKSYDDITVYSWVSTPIKSGKFPVFVRFFGFGRGNSNGKQLPSKWFLNQKNRINITVDIRGQGLSKDEIKFNGYLTKGLGDKKDYIYRGAYLDAVKAVDYASTLPNGDGNIVVMGGSQGGALATVTAALNPKVTLCVANFPFLTDMYNYNKKKWPMKIWLHETKVRERKLEDLHKTLSYFDVLNFADKVKVPFFLRTQETDSVTPKEGAIKLFNSINSTVKEMYVEDCNGHGCSSKSKDLNKLEYEFVMRNINK